LFNIYDYFEKCDKIFIVIIRLVYGLEENIGIFEKGVSLNGIIT